jgi:hypothetical protein
VVIPRERQHSHYRGSAGIIVVWGKVYKTHAMTGAL